MPAYGRLSGRNRDDQIAGARVEVAPYKRDPADFVLWKPSTPEQPGWESPWGRGRPGWHIECSAMSEHFLGAPFDIHGGGLDLIFPHHENEIAQSCCVHDIDRMANYWMHNGFVDMSGEKMSKSVGNVLRIDEALELASSEVIRWWMLNTNYRQPIDFSDDAIKEADSAVDKLYTALSKEPETSSQELDVELVDMLCDDLNTREALTRIHQLIKDVNTANASSIAACVSRLKSSANILGLGNEPVLSWFHGNIADAERATIERLIGERDAARRSKNFTRADQIRDELIRAGVILEDTPTGTTWRRA